MRTKMRMNKNMTKWVNALEAGKYRQATGCLTNDGKFCCLGVACQLAKKEGVVKREDYRYDDEESVLPESVMDYLGVNDSNPDITWSKKDKQALPKVQLHIGQVVCLTSLNDEHNLTFRQIAGIIRRHYKELVGGQ